MSSDELADTGAFMDWLEHRNPHQPEFLQAVEEVVEHVIDIARDTEAYASDRILQRLTEPDRVIKFRVVWENDAGDVQMTRGYRIQHTNSIGPYKGGLRFDAGVSESVLKFLAFEQAFKNSLTGLNLGAGKGGAVLDPADMSDREIMRFCQSYMTELFRHIGAETDVPAGDIGVGGREIGYLFGQYKRLQNQFTGALTGKPPMFGGSLLREEATGYGAAYFLCAMLEDRGESIEDQRLAISGAGNVALHVAEKARAMGAAPVSLSNRDGCLHKPDGLTASDIERVKRDYPDGTPLPDIAEAIDAEWMEGGKPWTLDCTVAVPSATQNELDAEDAATLVDNGCRIVVEGANMPLTQDAKRRLKSSGIPVAPGKAANAGGVAVSGLEMMQNRMGRSWDADRLDSDLRDIMRGIFRKICEESDDGESIDYCRGADRAGFRRVANALVSFGRI